jgi:hypothetical protein
MAKRASSSVEVVGNIIVGPKDVDIAAPSHVPGVHQGNMPMKLRHTEGVETGDVKDITVPTRSTSINPRMQWPIDPRMPKLTPP